MKKILLILLIIGVIVSLLVGCNAVTPPPNGSEGEGEGEGEEETVSRVVLVELFTSHCPYCIIAEPILEQIAGEYERSEMILVEVGIGGSAITAGGNERYIWYLPNTDDRKTPNTFFNGSNQRVWLTGSYYTFKSKIVAELAKEAKISIQVSKTENSGSVTLSGSIKNISTTTLSYLVINGMIFKNNGITGEKYMVSKIIKDTGEVGVTLASGAEQSFEFVLEDLNWSANDHGVIFVQDSSTKEILQAKYVE
jgi:thiol-disulfide isomerase/thioredoxin